MWKIEWRWSGFNPSIYFFCKLMAAEQTKVLKLKCDCINHAKQFKVSRHQEAADLRCDWRVITYFCQWVSLSLKNRLADWRTWPNDLILLSLLCPCFQSTLDLCSPFLSRRKFSLNSTYVNEFHWVCQFWWDHFLQYLYYFQLMWQT